MDDTHVEGLTGGLCNSTNGTNQQPSPTVYNRFKQKINSRFTRFRDARFVATARVLCDLKESSMLNEN